METKEIQKKKMKKEIPFDSTSTLLCILSQNIKDILLQGHMFTHVYNSTIQNSQSWTIMVCEINQTHKINNTKYE